MAFSIKENIQGFRFKYNTLGALGSHKKPIALVLTPNTSFYKGDPVILTTGKIARAAANSKKIIGIMAETVLAADNPAASETKGLVWLLAFGDRFEVNFADQIEFTAVNSSSSTVTVATADTTVGDANDRHNGALLLCFSSTVGNAGQIRIVSDYDVASKTFTFTEPLDNTPADGDEWLVLGCKTATAPIGQFTRGMALKVATTKISIDANYDISSEAGPCILTGWDKLIDGVMEVEFMNSVLDED